MGSRGAGLLTHTPWGGEPGPESPPPPLFLPAAVDTATDPRAPRLAKTVEPEEIQGKTGLSFLHTSHCLGNGDIVVSALGSPEGAAKGGFVVLGSDLKVGLLCWGRGREVIACVAGMLSSALA